MYVEDDIKEVSALLWSVHTTLSAVPHYLENVDSFWDIQRNHQDKEQSKPMEN